MQRHIPKLFVFALYRLYEQGEAFVPKLKSLLASGSSKSPWELGFDIRTEEFWEKGMRQVETPLENARKASTYDSILDSFIVGRDVMVEVHVEGREPRYVKKRLSRKI